MVKLRLERDLPSQAVRQAARQGLAVLMASAVVVLKHVSKIKIQPFAKDTILYQLISNLAWVITLGRLPALPNLVRI